MHGLSLIWHIYTLRNTGHDLALRVFSTSQLVTILRQQTFSFGRKREKYGAKVDCLYFYFVGTRRDSVFQTTRFYRFYHLAEAVIKKTHIDELELMKDSLQCISRYSIE